MTNYSLWLTAIVFFVIYWVICESLLVQRCRAIVSVTLLSCAVVIGGFWGWVALVVAEASLFMGKANCQEKWGLNFTSLIPGALIYFQISETDLVPAFVPVALFIYFFFRMIDWPMKSFARFKESEANFRYFAILWCTAAAFLMVEDKNLMLGLGLLALLAVAVLSAQVSAVSVIAWSGMVALEPKLAILGAGWFLNVLLPGWWRLIGVIFFSMGWNLLSRQFAEPHFQAMIFLYAVLTSFGVMARPKLVIPGKLKPQWVVPPIMMFIFAGTFYWDLKILQMQNLTIEFFAPSGVALIGGLVGGWCFYKKPEWELKGFDIFPVLAKLLEDTSTEYQPSADLEDSLENEEKRPWLGEAGQLISWLVLIFFVAMVGQWLV